MSTLPIAKNSLKYGSADAARTVHADISELNEQMRIAGTKLNLEGHHVGMQSVYKFILLLRKLINLRELKVLTSYVFERKRKESDEKLI